MRVTGCPYHDLDPATAVSVTIHGRWFPMSAERACAQWHDAQMLQATLDEIRERWGEALDRLADL